MTDVNALADAAYRDLVVGDTVKVPVEEYDQMLKDLEWLNCLENAGVDSWEGYDEALALYNTGDNK